MALNNGVTQSPPRAPPWRSAESRDGEDNSTALSGLLNPTVSGPRPPHRRGPITARCLLNWFQLLLCCFAMERDLAVTTSKVRQVPAMLNSWEHWLRTLSAYPGPGRRRHCGHHLNQRQGGARRAMCCIQTGRQEWQRHKSRPRTGTCASLEGRCSAVPGDGWEGLSVSPRDPHFQECFAYVVRFLLKRWWKREVQKTR